MHSGAAMHSGWAVLPNEIRLLILQVLVQDGYTLSRLATVSREWQAVLERYNFARIKVTPSRLVNFVSMTRRNRALVKHIWFCLEIDDCDCTECEKKRTNVSTSKSLNITDADGYPLTKAFQNLFSILSTWDLDSNLILDISIHSSSDLDHGFKDLDFMPDIAPDMLNGCMEQAISNKVNNDFQYGRVARSLHYAQPSLATYKVFHSYMEEGQFDGEQSEREWWDQLPSVPAVTSVLIRQQSRQRWKPGPLAHMFARFPRLQEVHYEPWEERNSYLQVVTNREFRYLFNSLTRFNNNLKRLVIFENGKFDGIDLRGIIRGSGPAISREVALASLKLEHLAASFIVDARYFFEIEPSWEWLNLKSIALTSKLLLPNRDPIEIGAMLHAAAVAAIKMPHLETMEIWNGNRGMAAVFKYQVFHNIQEATITWRGTWNFTIEKSIILAWEAVIHRRYDGCRLNLVQEWLDETAVKSDGDAIHCLMLSSQVMRPISLQQIQTVGTLRAVSTCGLDVVALRRLLGSA